MSDATPIDSLNETVSHALLFNKKPLPITFEIYSISVHKEINKISRAVIKILGGNPKLNLFEEAESNLFKPGTDVEIKMGYNQHNSSVFQGIVEKNGLSIREGFHEYKSKRLLVIECVDKAIEMTKTYTSDIYEAKKDSEIITSLISKAGLKKTVTATTVKHAFLPKYNTNDWNFMLQRANSNGLIVINSDNVITVKKPSGTGSPTLTVKHGDGLLDFEGKIDGGDQLNALQFSGYDPFQKKSLNSNASEPKLTPQGDLKGKNMALNSSPSKTEVIVPQPLDTAELAEIANASLTHSRLKSVHGMAKVKGIKTGKIDSLIKLTGFGSRLDGSCYVTSIQHELSRGNFFTTFGFGLKDTLNGQNKGIDISKLVPPINGLHVGEVKKIDKDPDNEYRIKVLIPALKASGDGLWARLTHFYTSPGAGSFFIPEVKSQVVVSFINNDPRYPVILGGLYTKTTKPYTEIKAKNEKKAFVSKEKLTIEFDEKDKDIIIKTSDKNKITISEKKKGITIEDQNGNEIITSKSGISISSKKQIKISSKADVSITGSKGVTISGKSGKGLNFDGSKVNVKSKAKVNVKGSGVDLNGSGAINIKGGSVNIN